MTDLLSALLRGVFMLAAGLLVLGVAAVLLLFTLAFVLVAWIRGVLTGRRLSWQSSWAHVQRSAASAMWQKYQQTYQQTYQRTSRPGAQAAATSQGSRPAGGAQGDVVDVDFREVQDPHCPPADPPHRIGSDGPR
ncbi:MAG TPA: hypothetical protein PK347_07345 [Burkholderiaceae bacterium]|nr:hypothetical protein [Burkholderiaceae bacterium]